MQIQEEAPSPTSLLDGLEDDYKHAVLHVAWDRDSEANQRTLLFGFVELVPGEIPPPVDDYDPSSAHCCLRLGQHYVYVRHSVATARKGIDWYLACRRGLGFLPDDDHSAKPLQLPDLGEVPIWPTMVAASDNADTIPFCPQWIHCPRVHHLLPLADLDLDQLWPTREREKVRHWLDGRLHFDLNDYSEYWGSLHLVAPNPVYRELNTRLQPRTPPAESVLMRFQPRAGSSVQGLELAFSEKDPWGVTVSRRMPVRTPLMRMSLDREVNLVATDVFDPRRGPLEVSSNAHAFLKRIQIHFGFASQRVVQTPTETYEVTRSSKHEVSGVGSDHKAIPAHARLVAAHYARRKRRDASDHGQQWFRGEQAEARDVIRSILIEASAHVLLIDPYFGAEELGSFMLAVGREDIPIRIVTSAEILRRQSPQPRREKGEHLAETLQHLESQGVGTQLEIRVMPGKRPAIHDRFLMVDKRIWLLGSSLNELGARGTMIVSLPDPDGVRANLEQAWNESQPLEDWLTRRRKERAGDGESRS